MMNLSGPYDDGEVVVFYDHGKGVEIFVDPATGIIESAFEKRGSNLYGIELSDETKEEIAERMEA